MATVDKSKEKAPRLFDAAEYSAKLSAALDKLKAEKKPGEFSGKVGKSEILKSGAAEMQALIDQGFTLKQISDAISDDVFKIMPKSLTEALAGKKKKPVRRQQKSVISAGHSSASTAEGVNKLKPNNSDKSTFSTTKDTSNDDL